MPDLPVLPPAEQVTPQRPNKEAHEEAARTPPFSTPSLRDAADEPVSGGLNQTAAPDSGSIPEMHNEAVDKGPCAATLKDDAKGGAEAAVALSMAQGHSRLVQKSTTSPVLRFCNDLERTREKTLEYVADNCTSDVTSTPIISVIKTLVLDKMPNTDTTHVPQVAEQPKPQDDAAGYDKGSQNIPISGLAVDPVVRAAQQQGHEGRGELPRDQATIHTQTQGLVPRAAENLTQTHQQNVIRQLQIS